MVNPETVVEGTCNNCDGGLSYDEEWMGDIRCPHCKIFIVICGRPTKYLIKKEENAEETENTANGS